MPVYNIIQAVNDAIKLEMRRNQKVVLLGEDVGKFGGVFRATSGLQEEFGKDRVMDTPLAEAGIIGAAIGMALYGLRPIAEIQFADFIYPAFDQIVNELAKFRYRSGGEYPCPVVIRTPYGGGIRGGHYHSQSPETYFAHTPGLKVIIPATPYDAKGLLKSAIRDDDPVIFIEGELLYGEQGEVPDGEHLVPLGKGDIKRKGTDCTIVAYSKMVGLALEAAKVLEKEGISLEVVDPRTLRPLDEDLIFSSVRKTNRCVILQEAPPHSSFGGEVALRVQRACFDDLDAPIERVASEDLPVPYALNLEAIVLPDVARVVKAVKRTMYLE